MSKRTSKTSKRPYWQSQPCPAWCLGGHPQDTGVGDRHHVSNWAIGVKLSLYPAEVFGSGDSRHSYAPQVVTYLIQGDREFAPRVAVDPEAAKGLLTRTEYTLEEAEELGKALLKAVKLAGGVDR